jgi:hypothetical protein
VKKRRSCEGCCHLKKGAENDYCLWPIRTGEWVEEVEDYNARRQTTRLAFVYRDGSRDDGPWELDWPVARLVQDPEGMCGSERRLYEPQLFTGRGTRI